MVEHRRIEKGLSERMSDLISRTEALKYIPSEDLISRMVIAQLPTIEVESIKHGKWINDNGLYKCSVCNEFTITGWANCIPIEQMNKTMKYCNNCGAKMDGEEDD